MAIKAEHAFNTDALKAVVAKYGNKLRFIKTPYTLIAVNRKYNNMPYIDSNNLSTFDAGGYDMLEVTSYDPFARLEYKSVIRVEDIIDFVVVNNDNDMIDPFRV